MKLYHMSDTLQSGDVLAPDYKRNAGLAEPFVRALQCSQDVFYAMILNAYYVGEVLARYNMRGMPTNETKWACEGLFEYIRRTEFPEKCSRLKSNYYFDTLESCKKLYLEGWKNASAEDKQKIRLFEVEVDGGICKYDMQLFDRAYDLLADLESTEGIAEIYEIARAYYRGDCTENSVMELLSEGKAVAMQEISTSFTYMDS